MQIGTRWQADEPAPDSLPAVLRSAIADTGLASGAWTLTWLEGRPVAEHDDGTVLAIAPDGSVGSPAHAVLDEPDALDEDDDDLFPVE